MLTGTLAVLVASTLVPAPAVAAPVGPTLEFRSTGREIVARRNAKGVASLNLRLYLAALGEPFEVQIYRDSYTDPIEVDQVLRGDDGSTERSPLPSLVLDRRGRGLNDFFKVRIVRRTGEPVTTLYRDFCPGSYEQERVNDEGPLNPTYPSSCFRGPFATGVVWGVDEGWASSVQGYRSWRVKLTTGRYRAIVSVDEGYEELLGLDAAPEIRVPFRVRRHVQRRGGGCNDCPIPVFGRTATSTDNRAEQAAVPDDTTPDQDTLPDLIALPAWGMGVEEGRRTRLTFGATVWVGGAQSLVVEGFRRSDEEKMDAYQYFYENGEPVGRAAVGDFAYDSRRGHRHWHFLQFARYSLLDETKTEVVRSRKEAFCLAPTDAIDMLLPRAEWSPDNTDLSTACGEQDSLWIREVLPLGWGDTYFQWIPGQSFDVSDLPNGTYYVKVEANPGGSLYEQTADNNVELRKVHLRGKPGRRRVVVPAWNGIDTEGRMGFGFF